MHGGDSQVGSGRHISVLCIDDEPHVLSTTSKVLEMNGFRVLSARDSKEAKALASENHVDVALIDYSVCLTDRVCLRELLPGVKCLIHSGNPELADRPDCVAAVTVVAKPVHPLELVAVIRKILAI